jgi:hypothetical protein
MCALNATFELFDTAQLPAAARNGTMQQGSKLPGRGKPNGKYKNSGNKAKEYLKTKDITFFDAAYFASFVRRSAPIRPHKEQEPPRCAKTKPGLAARLEMP